MILQRVRTVLDYLGPVGLAGAAFHAVRGSIARGLGRRFVRRRVYDYEMWIDLDDRGLSRTLLLFGQRELEHKILLERLVRPGMTILDIGANIGYYVFMESGLTGPGGKVVAIEPSPTNVALLRQNVGLNRAANVTVVEAAVSDIAGERALFLSASSNLNTFHPVDVSPATDQDRTVKVRTTTVPALAAEHGAPDLIRMDVEGHEVEIIDGMLEAIRGRVLAPMLIFEVHRDRYSREHDFERTLRNLFACGYRVSYMGSSQQSGTEKLRALGYASSEEIRTDFMRRAIFQDIAEDDAIEIICRIGGARTVVLSPP